MGKLDAELADYMLFERGEDSERLRVIVKYYGDLQARKDLFTDIEIVELFQLYAVVELQKSELEAFAALPEVEYIELPKDIYFQVQEGRSVSCINSVQGGGVSGNPYQLTGRGVLVGIIDSGIDYTHPAFIGQDGQSRIRFLWDQTADSGDDLDRRPVGYSGGVEYSMEDINAALKAETEQERKAIVPVTDRGSGHGTAVAGVAAGNGNGSVGRRYRGVAIESELVVVKLGKAGESFVRTTEIMEGIDYILSKAIMLEMPVAINLSFGNNNGAHSGGTLFENYISDVSGVWKNVISIASGNEGDSRHHAKVNMASVTENVQFAVGEQIRELPIQVYKAYQDEIGFALNAPGGQRIVLNGRIGEGAQFEVEGNRVQVYFGEPTPYELVQELFIRLLPDRRNARQMVSPGVWSIDLIPEKIVDGVVQMWLPTSELIGLSTGFLRPQANTTLTVPSTARRVITVGAYNFINDTVASFSGRGDTTDGRLMPTIVAPGVNIMTTSVGGGYSVQTGTSIAAPFVTGSAALMMEWGIVRGNDRYLYGEKVKAYLIRGARPLPGEEVPSVRQGWGALCLRNSFS